MNNELVVVDLRDAKIEIPEWIWPNRIAKNKVTVVNGDWGIGKTRSIIKALANAFSGEDYPDGESPGQEGGHVAIITTETSAGFLKSMCWAQGISEDDVDTYFHNIVGTQDVSKAHSYMLDLDADYEKIKKYIELNHPIAVIIDPLIQFHSRNEIKSHEIRGLMVKLEALCTQYNLAIIPVIHWNKNDKAGDKMRMSGSHQYGAAAPCVITVKEHPKIKGTIIFDQEKNNLGPRPEPIMFTIEKPDGMVVWIDAIEIPVGEITLKTIEWLKDYTSDGPVPIQTIFDNAPAARATVYKAKNLIGSDMRRIRSKNANNRWEDSWEYVYDKGGLFKLSIDPPGN